MSLQDLSIIFLMVLGIWKNGTGRIWQMLSSIFKKAKKEDRDIFISVSLTSVPGKIMEMIIFRFIEKSLKGNAVTICAWKVLFN